MSSATSPVMQRTAAVQRPRPMGQQATEASRPLAFGKEEAAVLKINVSDLHVPSVGGLQVDGFKPSFFERLFGKK
jgi:hypothetical protein